MVAWLLALVLLAATFVALPAPADSPQATVASAQTVDYRVVLEATRTSGGDAPTASVTATTFARAGHGWRRTVSERLPGTHFWKVVTTPHAVCALTISSTRTPHVSVRLLQSPSLGCGRAVAIPLRG